MRFLITVAAACFAASAPAQDPAPAPAPDYDQAENWLCLPGRGDGCSTPLPTVALAANGYGSLGRVEPDATAKIDCFYVYPTVSRDPGNNSDLAAGPEEQAVVAAQFARFASLCRPFAPLYRQATLASLLRLMAGAPADAASVMDLAYADVKAAWRQYLAAHNQGRPFVLIGHSQGTVHLSRLIAEELEGRPEADRMLSAILLGFNIIVPEGRKVGGTFRRTPICTSLGETGCVVTFVSFRADSPPPDGAPFGRSPRPGMTVACTNPATLAAGKAALDSYFFTGGTSAGEPIAWSTQGPPPVPYVRTEGLVRGACVTEGSTGYLAIEVNADPADARTDRIPGDVVIAGRRVPGWGLHLADMNFAMGDLMRLIEAQRDAPQSRR